MAYPVYCQTLDILTQFMSIFVSVEKGEITIGQSNGDQDQDAPDEKEKEENGKEIHPFILQGPNCKMLLASSTPHPADISC